MANLEIKLNEDQISILNLIASGHNLSVQGQAGTGKSVLLKKVATTIESAGRFVTISGSTGISASQFPNAVTLHAFGGILDGRFSNSEAVHRVQCDHETKDRILRTDTLLIDEISLISAKTFEQVRQ